MSKLEKEGRKEAVSYVSPNEEVGDGRNGSQRASVFPGFALTWKSALKVTAGFGSPSRVDSRRLQLKCILPQRIITGRFVILARWQAFENWGQSVGEQGRWEGIGWGQPQPPTDCGEGGSAPWSGRSLGDSHPPHCYTRLEHCFIFSKQRIWNKYLFKKSFSSKTQLFPF